MKGQNKISRIPLLNLIGALALVLALGFQIIAGPNSSKSGNLADPDSMTYFLEKDGLAEFGSVEKVEFFQVFCRPKTLSSIALHLNTRLTNRNGLASMPHSNQARYILFRNQKLDCAI